MDQASSPALPWEKHLSAMEALVEVLFDLYTQTTVVCICKIALQSTSEKLNEKHFPGGMPPHPPTFTFFVKA